jgi:hypothetical protein
MGEIFNSIFGVIAGPLFLFIGFFVLYQVSVIVGVEFGGIVSILFALSPIWLPIALFYITYERWTSYQRLKFNMKNGRVTLRIHLPQEVLKSPEAMEQVLNQIFNGARPDNLMETYLDGKHPPTFSFELVSIGGEVRFYINVPRKRTKDAVETQLYAQYPGIEVTEEELDYTNEITWDPDKYGMMSFHATKKENECLPIKTYIDFGLDKMPKEEHKVEPMAAMLEQLGRIGPKERLWIQFLAVPHVARNFRNGYLFGGNELWNKKAEKTVNEMLKRDTRVDTNVDEYEKQPMLTMHERDKIAAVERNIGKYGYETAVRWMYIAEKDHFNGDILGLVIRTFSQYDIMNRNGIGTKWRTDFDYNFISDFSGKKKMRWRRAELMDYKLRRYNYREMKNKSDAPSVMSVEELATVFHIPSSSVVTPSLARITSTRKEAPSNLPTGLNIGM